MAFIFPSTCSSCKQKKKLVKSIGRMFFCVDCSGVTKTQVDLFRFKYSKPTAFIWSVDKNELDAGRVSFKVLKRRDNRVY